MAAPLPGASVNRAVIGSPASSVAVTSSGESPASRAFCQLLTHRYTRGSLVLTSNRGLDTWQQFLGDEVLAAAVLDRFLHHATVFSQTGESYRLKDAKRRRGKS